MLKRWIGPVLVALTIVVVASACTPEQYKQWMRDNGFDYSHKSEAQIAEEATNITNYWNEQLELAQFDWVLSDDQLYQLRMCESTDNYGAVGGGGAYRGAYQFNRSAWDSTAASFLPRYVGMDPASAPPKVQDAMTRALWSSRGPRPWPVCGYRV